MCAMKIKKIVYSGIAPHYIVFVNKYGAEKGILTNSIFLKSIAYPKVSC